MSQLKVVELNQQKTDVNDTVVDRLKEALAMAESGELVSIALAGRTSDQGVVTCWANTEHPYVMVGAIESLKVDFISASIE